MSPDTTDTVATPDDTPTLSVEEASARLAGILAFEDRLTAYVKTERAHVFEQLRAHQAETKKKSVEAEVDGEPVVTFTIKEGKPSVVVDDEDDFLEWVLVHHPAEVETVSRVNPEFKAAYLKTVEHDEHGVRDPETGEDVPGLAHKPAPEPTTFNTRWKGSEAGKERALGAVLRGRVSDVLGIEVGDDQ